MATDLFSKYYNNPSKSYIYSNMLCTNGSSASDISFDITDSEGVISDNINKLSGINLNDIHVSLTQYTNDMKIIDPYGIVYVKGVDTGSAYTNKSFGKINTASYTEEQILNASILIFKIKYVNDKGIKVEKLFSISAEEDMNIIVHTQKHLDANKIPISITYTDGYFNFTSTSLGYDFWIDHLNLFIYVGTDNFSSTVVNNLLSASNSKSNKKGFGYDDEWAEGSEYISSNLTDNAYIDVISESDYQTRYARLYEQYCNTASTKDDPEDFDVLYLFEDLTKYIPAQKYRNGAMKGCVVVAEYPKYNAENISDTEHSLKIGHLADRVEEFYTSKENEYSGLPLYVRIIRDVVDSYFSQYEFDLYQKWCKYYSTTNVNDSWIDPEEIPYVVEDESDWTHSHVSSTYVLNSLYKNAKKYDAIGLYGYANYLSKHNRWTNIGQLYSRTTVEDDESKNSKNLINSFIIYNPNSFPVTIKYMTFA